MAKNFSRTALSAALAKNAGLPANCFTVGRFGEPKVGIELSLDRGSNEFWPLEPHVLVGSFRIHRDAYRGCLYDMAEDKRTATVVRAELRECTASATGKLFYTLTQPAADKVAYSLVKVNTALPYAKGPIMLNGRPLHLFAGHTGGTTIGADGWEALVQLAEGEWLDVFFEDGAVRRFVRQGPTLEERFLRPEEQLELRIERGWVELERVLELDGGTRERATGYLLSGMADLLHLTTRFDARGLGQGMRVTLLRKFLLELPPEALQLCHRKVTAILYQVDPPLVAMLRVDGGARDLPTGVADFAAERTKREAAKEATPALLLSPEERERQRAENIRCAAEAKAKKEAEQAKFKAERAARAASKAAQSAKPAKQGKKQAARNKKAA